MSSQQKEKSAKKSATKSKKTSDYKEEKVHSTKRMDSVDLPSSMRKTNSQSKKDDHPRSNSKSANHKIEDEKHHVVEEGKNSTKQTGRTSRNNSNSVSKNKPRGRPLT